MKRFFKWLMSFFKKEDKEPEVKPDDLFDMEEDEGRDNEDTDKPDDGGDYPEYPKDKEDLWYPLAIKSQANY